MHGKMLQLIREVYSNVKVTVLTDEGLTDVFECRLGVRQGCMLSPRLFIIFINELEKMLKSRNLGEFQWEMQLTSSY